MKNDHTNLIDRVLPKLRRTELRLNIDTPITRNGLPVLPNSRTTRPVAPELVNQLRDENSLSAGGYKCSIDKTVAYG
ncbi:hypothetical protein [Burkholderia ubonensis]|uniref:hypothetical protein n=1 Tax=Burkholderia ubonensis TaxID=101571 RepID=UPI000AFCF48A|nr:hypothetical protein [Burkholderia ubonensis]